MLEIGKSYTYIDFNGVSRSFRVETHIGETHGIKYISGTQNRDLIGDNSWIANNATPMEITVGQ